MHTKTDSIEMLFTNGLSLHKAGALIEAAITYENILKIHANHFDALHLLATIKHQYGKNEDSIILFERALAINNRVASVYNNYGLTLHALMSYEKAIVAFNEAIKINPQYATAFYNLGNAYYQLNQFESAIHAYNQSLQLNPHSHDAYYNCANAYRSIEKGSDAIGCYSKALLLNPKHYDALFNRANLYLDQGAHELALKDYALLHQEQPEYNYALGNMIHTKMHLCDWSDYELSIKILEDGLANDLDVCTPFPILSLLDNPLLQKKAAERYANRNYPVQQLKPTKRRVNPSGKIKIGYFSADFHNHATMHLMAELFECHDKSTFETYAFSFGPITNDPWQQRAKKAFDHFIICNNISDQDIADLARSKEIDIAIDLKGYTSGNRTGIFAYRSAPIQINYLGYPGTMGAKYIDYIIVDHQLVHDELTEFYTERCLFLPHCYQPNCSITLLAEFSSNRSEFGLPEESFIFASFNNPYKITPPIFRSWMNILNSVEDSVIWILAPSKIIQSNLSNQAISHGINASRLIFANKIPMHDHMKRIKHIDLALDTFPYSSHTTCSDYIRSNVPILTLAGKTFASRVASSLLREVGLNDLVTYNVKDYEDAAIRIAKNRRIESDILSSNGALFNPKKICHSLEKIYKAILEC